MGSKATWTNRRLTSDPIASLSMNGVITTYPAETTAWKDTFTRTGVDDPLWYNKMKLGLSVTNPMTVVDSRWAGSLLPVVLVGRNVTPLDRNLGVVIRNNAPGFTYVMRADRGSLSHSAFVQLEKDADNDAAIGIRKKIYQDASRLQGGVLLKELSQTASLLLSPAKALRKLLSQFMNRARKIPGRKTERARKLFAEQWLEYSFGAVPLMMDITAISELLYEQQKDVVHRLSHTSQRKHAVAMPTEVGTVAGNPYKIPYYGNTYYEVSVRYLIGNHAHVFSDEGSIVRLVELGGFNLQDFIPSVWEAVPWSFLIDYFTNIGDVLMATNVSTSSVRWVNKTTVKTSTVLWTSGKVYIDDPNPRQHAIVSFGNNWCYGQQRRVDRTAGAIPLPELRFELPGRNVQFLNMAALYFARRNPPS